MANGKFEKGHTGAKKKGDVHKTTAKAKELILDAIDKQSVNFNKVMGDLKDKEPREWAKIMVKLMDFVLPKKLDITTDEKPLNIPISTWANDSKES